MELLGNVKNYDWGKLGKESAVAQLASLNSFEFRINPNESYSELWMGDHSSGPSKVKASGEELGKVTSASLPFLFKVLSIRKALSIQVHPNKAEAERLHRERPDIYKDPNHKPELAIALTPFVALCGFRPNEEIHQFLQELPPLKALLGGDKFVDKLKNQPTTGLRKCYAKLITSNAEDNAYCINNIAENYENVLSENNLLEIFNTIKDDFPGDVGVLSLFFLNIIRLQPGEAIYLGANEIHAYLSGDCVECMACSDNVIRAGLTPKYKDIEQLIASLNYIGLPASSKLFVPKQLNEQVQIFAPPVDDFAVLKLNLTSASGDYTLELEPHGSILITLEGLSKLKVKGFCDVRLRRGSIVYIPAEAAKDIQFIGNEDFVAYLATYNTFQK